MISEHATMAIQAVIMRERMVFNMGVSLEGILSLMYRQEREKLEVRHTKIVQRGNSCLS
ncbi:hypothetical protein D3C80_2022720 [compost metagenome]